MKVLSTLFHINKLTDAHNRLVSLWLTGERQYTILPTQTAQTICYLGFRPWISWNSNLQSRNNSTNAFLVHHLGAMEEKTVLIMDAKKCGRKVGRSKTSRETGNTVSQTISELAECSACVSHITYPCVSSDEMLVHVSPSICFLN